MDALFLSYCCSSLPISEGDVLTRLRCTLHLEVFDMVKDAEPDTLHVSQRNRAGPRRDQSVVVDVIVEYFEDMECAIPGCDGENHHEMKLYFIDYQVYI